MYCIQDLEKNNFKNIFLISINQNDALIKLNLYINKQNKFKLYMLHG